MLVARCPQQSVDVANDRQLSKLGGVWSDVHVRMMAVIQPAMLQLDDRCSCRCQYRLFGGDCAKYASAAWTVHCVEEMVRSCWLQSACVAGGFDAAACSLQRLG